MERLWKTQSGITGDQSTQGLNVLLEQGPDLSRHHRYNNGSTYYSGHKASMERHLPKTRTKT